MPVVIENISSVFLFLWTEIKTCIPLSQLLNNGPSTFSKAALEVKWPYQFRNSSLLYITSYDTEGPINCTTDIQINPLNVSVRHTNTETTQMHTNTQTVHNIQLLSTVLSPVILKILLLNLCLKVWLSQPWIILKRSADIKLVLGCTLYHFVPKHAESV